MGCGLRFPNLRRDFCSSGQIKIGCRRLTGSRGVPRCRLASWFPIFLSWLPPAIRVSDAHLTAFAGWRQSRQRIGVAVRCDDQMSPRSAEI